MRLSVIMPVYNHAHFIPRAVQAIIEQSLRPDELIIIDDGSTDDAMEVISKLAREHTFIRPIHLKRNEGTAAAVRHGRALATGDFICLASADDVIQGAFFEKSVELLESRSDIPFSTALTDQADVDNLDLVSDRAIVIERNEVADLICKRGTWFRCNTAVYRRDVLEKVGGFDPRLGPFSDGFLCMMLALQNGCGFVPEVFSAINMDQDSISNLLSKSIDKSVAVFELAEHEMTERYKDIFPTNVVKAWGKQWRFAVACHIIAFPQSAWSKWFKLLTPPLRKIDISIVRILGAFTRKLARGYILWRLSPSYFYRRLQLTKRSRTSR